MKTGLESKDHGPLLELYRETGMNFRYFIDWRHKIMERCFIILGGLGIAAGWMYGHENLLNILWIIPLFGAGLTLAFYVMDRRTKTLFRTCAKIGEDLEEKLCTTGAIGIYKKYNEIKYYRITYTSVLSGIYIVMFFSLASFTVYLLVKY